MHEHTPELKRTIDRLFDRRKLGIKLGLEPMTALLNALGNPEASLRAVHVAGTNGKGSVCAIIASVLQASGLTVGRTISPHLRRFNERFVVQGEAISDEALADIIARVEPVADSVGQEISQELTFFECSTAIAFSHFAAAPVDWAVIETGLGGRLDATNVIRPVVSVITQIGLDHMRMLGEDLSSIATEKAGIIKPGAPVIVGPLDSESEHVIRSVAEERGAAFMRAEDLVSVAVKSRTLEGQSVQVETAGGRGFSAPFSLLGDHQVENLATALATVEVLHMAGAVSVDEAAYRQGVSGVQWPGRFGCVQRDPTVIVDGAHNPDAATALARTLKQVCPREPVGLVVGMCGDKDLKATLAQLGRSASHAWIVPIDHIRNADPADIRAALPVSVTHVEQCSVAEGLSRAKQWARESGGIVCAAGSLFLVGDVLECLGDSG